MKTFLIILCILIASPAMCGLDFVAADSDVIDLGLGLIGSDLNGASAVTVALWYKQDQLFADNTSHYLLNGIVGNKASFSLAVRNDAGVDNVRVSGRSIDTDDFKQCKKAYSDIGNWVHLVGILDYANDEFRLYVNGSLFETCSSVGWGENTLNNSPSTVVSDCIGGDRYRDNYYFIGTLDDVRIYGRALSLPEIQTIYHSRGSDNIAGLVGEWRMNEGSSGSVASGTDSCIDISGNGNDGTPTNSPIYRATPIKLIRRPR